MTLWGKSCFTTRRNTPVIPVITRFSLLLSLLCLAVIQNTAVYFCRRQERNKIQWKVAVKTALVLKHVDKCFRGHFRGGLR